MLSLLTRSSLQLIKKTCFIKKKVLLGCTCFSKGCAVGGKQMVSHKKWMGGCVQACCQACPQCCVAARAFAFAVPVRPGLPPAPGYQRCCTGFSLWLVPLQQQSPLFLPALACVLGRAVRQPSTGCPSLPTRLGAPSLNEGRPVLVALLPPKSVCSSDSSLLASAGWRVLHVRLRPATLVGQHCVLVCPEDKGIATSLPSPSARACSALQASRPCLRPVNLGASSV